MDNAEKKIAYVNNTQQDVSAPMFHRAIMAAIAMGGVFDEDLAGVFSLRCVEVDGAARWILEMA